MFLITYAIHKNENHATTLMCSSQQRAMNGLNHIQTKTTNPIKQMKMNTKKTAMILAGGLMFAGNVGAATSFTSSFESDNGDWT